jgi:voltage-gated potassium channel
LPEPSEAVAVPSERQRLAAELMEQTRGPLNVLAVVWLLLVLLDLAGLLGPRLAVVNDVIWAIFGITFLLELWIAPNRKDFLKKNWFAALTLVLPALRVVRVLRGVRLLTRVQGLRALSISRVVASLNKGLYSLNRILRRHKLGYVLAFTVVVIMGAAALIFRFESTALLGRPSSGGALDTFGDALWWAAENTSFAGSDYEVRTNVGRALRLFISFYAWSGFGYLTATVASRFLAPHQEPGGHDPVGTLNKEVQELRREVTRLREHLGGEGG